MPATAFVCVALALLIRLTIRDHIALLAALYYATPPIVLAGGAGLAGGMWFKRGKRRPALVSLAIALVCLVWWHQVSFGYRARVDSPGVHRLVLWNIAHGHRSPAGIARELAALRPDIAVLVEAWLSPDCHRALRQAFPDYEFSSSSGGLLIMTRGHLSHGGVHRLGRGMRQKTVDIVLDEQELTLVAVDGESNPVIPRAPALRALADVIAPRAAGPLIIAGDFNTPPDSVHLSALRKLVSRAAETCGVGYTPTWPTPLPVLTLDQVWHNDAIRPVSRYCASTWRSDHRPVIFEFARSSSEGGLDN